MLLRHVNLDLLAVAVAIVLLSTGRHHYDVGADHVEDVVVDVSIAGMSLLQIAVVVAVTVAGLDELLQLELQSDDVCYFQTSNYDDVDDYHDGDEGGAGE